MKQLRILTGIHAGATAPLGPGLHRIDADDDADIRITDWTGPSAIVEVGDNDVVTVRRLAVRAADAAASDAAPLDEQTQQDDASEPETQAPSDEAVEDTAPVFMLDFLPMQFDQSVICIGPDDVEWPSDLTLLSTLLKPGQSAEADSNKARSRRRTFVALGAACVALAVIASVGALSLTTRAKASMLPGDVAAMENVNREFASAHLNELRASLDGHGGVLVRGLVANEAENLAARRLLATITSPRMQAQYGIAEVIRRSIGESLPVAGISVHYDGGGVFSIAGKDVDMDALQQGVKRIRPDLPANVKDIRIDATGAEQADAPAGASYIAIVSSDTVRYAQTPDGVKHIFILDNETAASGASGATAASDTASSTGAAAPQPASDTAQPAASATASEVSQAMHESQASIAKQLAGPATARHTLDLPHTSVAQTADTLRR
ncbi:type III secretion protein [Paraburkholderia sp. Tr-20389]|uniref:type III secretion protein n=1 Tax=Paraburkholderia sp. Tr-20389 TaxID=2703903 RepID=UPI00197CDCD3|nr:type III secretion protein [Paraburkholderia sp. Tr-20389]MBN3751837.1 type III secretion protein [Paraburkholderia sp. Tr-20389]